MSDVVRLVPQEVGEEFRFDADEVLEQMKGKVYARLIIIGEIDGERVINGNCNAGEALVLMELAKHDLIFGED